jgi:hypothetical protein
VLAVHNALDYARVAYLSGGDCAPLDVIPTLPRARTHGDTSVTALFEDEARGCVKGRPCGSLRIVEADVLVRRSPGTGAQVELQHIHSSQPCPSRAACKDALRKLSR